MDEKQVLKAYNDWPHDAGLEYTPEQIEPIELLITGDIPHYAAGTLFRTGPGGYRVQTNQGTEFSMSHWFDGFTLTHRFDLVPSQHGHLEKVIYRSRSSCDDVIDSVRKTGKFSKITFGQKQDPCQSFFRKLMTAFHAMRSYRGRKKSASDRIVGVTMTVNMPAPERFKAPVSNSHSSESPITLHNNTDAAFHQQLDPETLEPVGVAFQNVLHPELSGPLSATHAQRDAQTGDIYNYNLDFGRYPTYRVFRVSASTGETEILARITGPSVRATYIHSLFMTENYVILCAWGSAYKSGGLRVLLEVNMLDAISDWDATAKTTWYIVDRRRGRGVVATYESDAFFAFHTINAWEDGDDVVCDVCTYDNDDVLKRFYYENLLSTAKGAHDMMATRSEGAQAHLTRWRLPAVPHESNTTSTPDLSTPSPRNAIRQWRAPYSSSLELSTINPQYATRPSRYIWGLTDLGESTFIDGIGKFDTETQELRRWSVHGHTPGEPIFVADPDRMDEDEGVLLSVVLDGKNEGSYLLCLDARTLEEKGRAEVGIVVALGFHGVHTKTLL
ncbi:hypothetical protein MMC25_003466 [Agyrium rufum]|nr:hypothetical protein [Agyrium rufum]